jgi:hypothetical protein
MTAVATVRAPEIPRFIVFPQPLRMPEVETREPDPGWEVAACP